MIAFEVLADRCRTIFTLAYLRRSPIPVNGPGIGSATLLLGELVTIIIHGGAELGKRSTPRVEPQLGVLSVFSGIGGLDLGLEKAGFRTLACIENGEFARRSILQSPLKLPLLDQGDVTKVVESISPHHFGLRERELAVLAGGPPCQPFSKAAQWTSTGRQGADDQRAACFESFLDLAETFLPRAVLIENVQGFVQGRESALPQLASRLRRINEAHGTRYEPHCRIVNAADFGVPQRRYRAIVVAFRDGEAWKWPKPTHATNPVRAWDAIGHLRLKDDEYLPLRGKYKTLLPSIPEGANYLHFTERGRGRYNLFGYRTRYWSFLLKLAKNQPAWTIAASPGPATGPFHWDNRPLSLPELLRLQSFPAEWPVEGPRRERIRQIGNATPPLLAEVLGRSIAQQAFGLSCARGPALRISRRRNIPAARRARPLPTEWVARHGKYKAHAGEGAGPMPRTS